ncbi:MAG TPA: DUF4010 domain-containing protein [Gammaproteobacteria bacterium]|nr:DUF4010 domain-containing protein [Gammaproteobacteria bacterium]
MKITFLDVDTLFLWRMLLTVSLSFLVGLEFHKYQRAEGQGVGFGTARTLTLVGVMGFLLYALDPSGVLFALGFAVIALWLALYYKRRLDNDYPSLMAPVVCALVYILGLLAANAPQWFVAGYAVVIIFFLSAKPRIRSFADTVSGDEISTVAKFVIMAGIVLPLLPDRQIASFIPVTFRQTWFAVVAVSGVSYLSYVTQAHLFKSRGALLTGLLGGLYSSTATTIVMSHQARNAPTGTLTSPALILATAMMYVRLLALAALLAPVSVGQLAPPFCVAAALSVVAALVLARLQAQAGEAPTAAPDMHPLEFQVALLFALLFVLFATATRYVVGTYSTQGLKVMAFAVGFTEIDPFVLSVLSGQLDISMHAAVDAVVIATASNNILKAVFALTLARNRSVLPACGWLVLLTALSLAYVVF